MTATPTFAEAVWARAAADPDGEVLRVAGGVAWTARRLRDLAAAWAGELAGLVRPGEVVVTCVDAGPDAVALTTAISALGAVELPLDPAVRPDVAERLARAITPRAVIASGARAADDMPGRLAALTGRPLQLLDGPDRTLQPDRADPSPVVPVARPATAPALVMTTSGTTGRAKAALLPVGAPVGQARRVVRAMAYRPGDVLLSYFAWHHVNARHASVLPALLSGARVVLAPRFSASGFVDLVRREQVTAFNFMGAVCKMLLAQPATPHDRDHAVTRAYGGPAPAALVAEFEDRFGITLRQAYACTELGDVATTPSDDLRPGSAGLVVSDYDVRVVDPSGADVVAGEAGELLVRPRRPGLAFLEYVGDPAATRAAWHGSWFRTRDRGRFVDGWLHLEGRLGDVIRRRGVNLDPQQVEDALLAHPAIAEAAALAVPSELTEDEVLAVVVARAGAEVVPADLWSHCRDALPRAAVPRYLSVEPALPYTGTHKLDRAALRRRGLPAGAWDAESAVPVLPEVP